MPDAAIATRTLAAATRWEHPIEPGLTLRGGHLPGPGPLLHFLPGTAFGCRLYAPFLEPLAARQALFWQDLHGHGDADAGERPFAGWRQSMRWAFAVMDAHGIGTRTGPIVGLGHSYGGCLTLMMAAARPAYFSRLILTDPFMVPPAQERPYRQLIAAVVERTRRRNPVFADAGAVRRYLAGRLMFQNFAPAAVEAFINDNLRRQADGQLRLRCEPHIEAGVYDDVVDGLWPAVDALTVPTLILSGDRTVPFFAAGHAEAVQRNGQIRRRTLAGGHNYMLEAPSVAAAAVAAALADSAEQAA
ncbi:MAG: alpha/beta hydrolase [Pseudomonadota bacterium]|nr:alpha/beta hydrolase [Pseudomonadota bacterium]